MSNVNTRTKEHEMTGGLKLKLLAAVGALSLIAGASAADATIIISSGPAGGNPDENVLFNTGGQTGSTVQGHTNQTGTLVNFTGLESIHSAGGQADITGSDGGFNYLEWTLATPDTGYTDLKFNILADLNSSVTLTFYDQFGNNYSDTFNVSKNGQNFFRAHAIDGQLITLAKLSTTKDITHVQQVRLGGFGAVSEVPEPATWLTMIAGFGMVGFALRRRGAVNQVLA